MGILDKLKLYFKQKDYPLPPAVRTHPMQVRASGKRRLGRFVVEYATSATAYSAGSARIMLYDWGSLVKTKRISGIKADEAMTEFDRLTEIVRKIPQDTPSWQITELVK